MSETISTTLDIGITLTTPVTITATGAVLGLGDLAAIIGGGSPGTIVNNGVILSAGLAAIDLANGGTIDNRANGDISAVEAIDILGNGTVTNAGTIAGGFLGVYLATGTITNAAHGRIAGGIAMEDGIVVNQGEISSGYGADISFLTGGGVFNLGAGATISGIGHAGVNIGGGGGVVVNEGVITSATLQAGGDVDNSGYLGAATASYGLTGNGAYTSLVNTGVIVAASFAAQASVTNTSTGIVSGYQNGIVLDGGGYITNAGTIFGLGGKSGIVLGSLQSPPPGLAGILVSNGGVIVNAAAAAEIFGRQDGISLTGSLGTYLTNAGSIIGDTGIDNAGTGNLVLYDSGTITGLSGTAIDFGAAPGRLVLTGNAKINGAVIGTNPADQVVFAAGGRQTLTGLSGQFLNMTNFTNAADIAFAAATALAPGATLANTGTLNADGALDSLGTILNTGTIFGPLTLGGAYAPTAPIADPIILANQAAGRILSTLPTAIAERPGGAAATIINAGLIADTESGGVAIALTGNLDNLLILEPGSTITGAVEGGSTPGAATGSTLKLAAGAGIGTLTGLGTQYTGFATIELGPGATWNLAAPTGDIRVGAGADLIISTPAAATIDLAGANATLTLTDPAAFAGTIADFGAAQTIDLAALPYDPTATATLAPGNILDILSEGQTLAVQLDPTGTYEGDAFHLSSNGAGGTNITEAAIPCFLKGTPIRTPHGDIPVESLAIGGLITGADGETLAIKWLGKRRYGPAAAQDPDIQPILIKQSALADNIPATDLFLSPCHAILVEGHHIPAGALANGLSILPAPPRAGIEYFHIETEHHTSIIAANTPVETFIDDDSRRLFDNAAEFYRLYPDRPAAPLVFGVPRLDCGPKLEAIRAALARRAGAPPARHQPGPVTGFLESADRETITGWAYNHAAPATPMMVDILNRGAVIARILANAPRPDVKRAGFGHGRCGFSLTLPAPLPAFQRHEISARPAGTATALPGSPVVLDPGFLHDLATTGTIRHMVEAAMKSLADGQDISALEADLEVSASLVRARRPAAAAPRQSGRQPGRQGRLVLIIDETWPTPTRDAGSNAILSHAAALQSLGYRVAFCAASGPPQTALQAAGLLHLKARNIACHGQDGTPTEATIKHLARAGLDLIYLHRLAVAVSYAGLAKHHAPAARLIYAVADLHHVRLARQAALTGRPEHEDAARRTRATEFWAMRMADHVVTHSHQEAAYLRRIAKNISVHVIPWSVSPIAPSRSRAHLPDIAFIGGADHAPNADAVHYLAQDILPAFWRQNPEARCLIIGEAWPATLPAAQDPRLAIIGHQPDLAAALQTARLTIAPLRFGAGLKGKVLESFAAGLPCVMSPIAAEGFAFDDTLQTAIAAPAQFAATLHAIYRNPTHQRRLTRAARTLLTRDHSPAAITTAFATMLGLTAPHPVMPAAAGTRDFPYASTASAKNPPDWRAHSPA